MRSLASCPTYYSLALQDHPQDISSFAAMHVLLFFLICVVLLSYDTFALDDQSSEAVVDIAKYQIRLGGTKFFPDQKLVKLVAKSAKAAKRRLLTTVKQRSDRLAVMMLFTFDWTPPVTERAADRLTYLACALSKITSHIAPHTPVDIFLWVFEESLPFVPSWLREKFPMVHVMAIPSASWRIPANVGEPHTWRFYGSVFGVDYFLMGRWRMTFAPQFALAMGYKYFLQIDDDSFQLEPISFDIVQTFKKKNIYMGLRGRKMVELDIVLTGLPEFTRYWMETRNMTHPKHFPGTLFKHTKPARMEGFTLKGWDREIYAGNFVVMSTDFWFDEVVQDFVQAVLSTGSDIEMRWTEQAVQNIVRLLFLPEKSVYLFPKDALLHGKPLRSRMDIVQCPDSTEVTGFAIDYEEKISNNKFSCRFPVVRANTLSSQEIVDFKWFCKELEPYHGDCKQKSLRNKSFEWYSQGFCKAYFSEDEVEHCISTINDFSAQHCPKTIQGLQSKGAVKKDSGFQLHTHNKQYQ